LQSILKYYALTLSKPNSHVLVVPIVCSPQGPAKCCDDSHPIVKVKQKSTLGVLHTLCNKKHRKMSNFTSCIQLYTFNLWLNATFGFTN